MTASAVFDFCSARVACSVAIRACLLAVARANVALGKFADAQALLTEARQLIDSQGRSTSSLGREIELTWAPLPANVMSRQDAAGHWQHAAEIACINFGCDDERTREWTRMAAQAVGDSTKTPSRIAAGKPYEAQYAMAVDILAHAKSSLPETKQ